MAFPDFKVYMFWFWLLEKEAKDILLLNINRKLLSSLSKTIISLQ
jgi:hypothetical protein